MPDINTPFNTGALHLLNVIQMFQDYICTVASWSLTQINDFT